MPISSSSSQRGSGNGINSQHSRYYKRKLKNPPRVVPGKGNLRELPPVQSRDNLKQLPPVQSRNPRPMPPIKSRNPGLSDLVSKLGRSTVQSPGEDPTRKPDYEPNKQVRDFQPYGVGKPKYGSGRSMPNVGPVSGKEGYRDRDLKNRAMKSRQMKLLKNRSTTGGPMETEMDGAKPGKRSLPGSKIRY